jgi:hypothetical protein
MHPFTREDLVLEHSKDDLVLNLVKGFLKI